MEPVTEPVLSHDEMAALTAAAPTQSTSTVDRQGPAIPVDLTAGFVAVHRRFPHPQHMQVHLYDKLYPDQLQQDEQTGAWSMVDGSAMSVRNEPALARTGAQRFVIIQPRCMPPDVDKMHHQLSTGYAHALGAVACPKCWPDVWTQVWVNQSTEDGWMPLGYTDQGYQYTYEGVGVDRLADAYADNLDM